MKKIALTLLMLSAALLSSCGGKPSDTTAGTEKATEASAETTEGTTASTADSVEKEETTASSSEKNAETEPVEADELSVESIIGKTLGDLEDEYGITFDYAGQYSISHCYNDESGTLGYAPLVSFMLDDYRISTVTGAILLDNGSFRGIEAGMSYNEIVENTAYELSTPDNVMDGIYCAVIEDGSYKILIEWGEEWNENAPAQLIAVCSMDYSISEAELAAFNAQQALLYTDADSQPTFENIVGRRLNYVGEHFGTEFSYLGQFSFIYDYNDFSEDFPYLPITAFDFFEDENPKIIGAALGKGGSFMGITPGMTYNEMTEYISSDILGRPSFDEESGGFNLSAEVGGYILYIDWGESYFGDDEPCIYVAAYDKNYPMSEEDGAIYEGISTVVG